MSGYLRLVAGSDVGGDQGFRLGGSTVRGGPVPMTDLGACAGSAGAGRGLPGGVVTFLFSDIEGSTRLVKALRERYPQVLAEHRRLVRAAIAAHGGHEVDMQGDGFFVAFGGARQAVLCALDVQRALAAHRWPTGAPVPGADRRAHRARRC